MVRYPITAPQSQERPQRKRVRAAPLQTALAVDALEVAHQVPPEIAPGRHRGRAHPGRVIRPAARLGKGVEAALDQHRLQAVIKHMTRRARHLRPAHHQVPLTILLPSHRHRQIPLQIREPENQTAPTYTNGLLRNRCAGAPGLPWRWRSSVLP